MRKMAENITKSYSRVRSRKLEFLRVLIPNPFVKLRIPGKIAKSLQNEPHRRATLYSPHGKFWHVGISHEGDDMYLDEGWKEFAKALDLCTGYFVLFQHKVNMVFSVKIFDNTMCLKEYVRDSFKRPIQDLYEEDTVEIVGVPCAEDNMYCSLESPCKRKKLETSHIVKTKQGLEKREERINKETLKTSPLSPSFPRFVKIINSSHSTSNCLGIPKNFCMRHGLVSEREIFLVSTTGESWLAQFFLTLCDGKLKGFRDFARDNGLRTGDRCTFQLVKKNTFLVHVMSSGAEKQQYSPISVQNNANLIVPEFERVVSRCYLHSVYIPNRVRKAIGLVSECDLLLMNQEGRSWPVGFFFKSNGEGHIGSGWTKFLRENNLKEGARCIFKLVEKNVLLVNVVPKESTDTLCKEMHISTQEPNKEIMSTKDCSVLLERALIEVTDTNANGSLTSSVAEVPSIEAQEELQNSIIYSNSTGIEKVQSIEAVEKAQENSSLVYVEKAPSTESQKDKVQNNNCSSSTGTEKVQLMKVPEVAQKNMIPVCVEKVQSIEAVEKAQKDSSSIYVEKAPSTESQKNKAQNNNCSSLTGNEKVQLMKAQKAAQKNMISVCVEKVRSIEALEKEQKNLSSVSVEEAQSTESQKNKAQNNNCSSSTGIEKVQLIKAPEAAQKNMISVCVENAPCTEAHKEKVQCITYDSGSTGYEKIPVNEEKKSTSICVVRGLAINATGALSSSLVKEPSIEAQDELHHSISDLSSTGIEKMQSSSICVEKVLSIVATGALSSSLVKEPSTEAQEELQNSISDLSSTGIEKVQSLNTSDEVKKNLSSVYVEKTPSTEAHKEKVENTNHSSSTGTEKVQLIKTPEVHKNLNSVCVKKAPCIDAQKEMRHNNTNSSSSADIENTPIEEQKNSSSVCVKKVPCTDAQKQKVDKRKKDWSLPCVEKRPLIAGQEVQKKMGDWSSTRFPKLEKMVLPYNIHHNYTVLSREFCTTADLCSPRHLILKDTDGKTWRVGYSPNNGKGSLRWKKFTDDKKLKVGDKCIFKLVARDTLLVNVVRK